MIAIGTLGFYGALVFNIYGLQIQRGVYFSARAKAQAGGGNVLSPVRGTIFFQDKNGNKIPVAFNREFPMIFAVPKDIEDSAEASAAIAEALGLEATEIKPRLEKANDEYELLVPKATADQVAKIRALALKGVYVASDYFRFYPFGSLGSQVLGFVGPDSATGAFSGRYGLESYYDDTLQRSDLTLTIDRNIQSQAEKVLKDLIEKYDAEGGTVIVQEPQTGNILALGNYPNFDPNEYAKSALRNFINPAMQSVYEPGSVFKVLTMAAGLDSGKITPATSFYDTGSLTLNGKTIKNWDGKAHGQTTMTEVIEQSINTGAAFAEKKTGHDLFYNYLLKFGLDEITGITLPGELSGKLGNLKISTRDINFATASFGQGVSVTPLQLVNAISALANRGILMRPNLLAGHPPEAIGEVISPEAAGKVTEMMVSAVNKAGVAKIDGYRIAGKTGTAQVPDFRRGGYSDQYIHSYIGFAPASDPKFTILIKVDKPKGVGLAGSTVVPAFRELAQFVINYYNIPADRLAE